jgi:hypothetical protein
VESFITDVSTEDVSPEKVIELVYQLHEISKQESIPLNQVSAYIGKKLEEKQKLDEDVNQADAILESKNVSIEAINEHIQLNEQLKKYRLSTKDIHRLVNLLLSAKEYRYSPGKIVALNIDIKQLLVFDNIANQLAKQYSLPPYVATLRLFNGIRDYDKTIRSITKIFLRRLGQLHCYSHMQLECFKSSLILLINIRAC